jgi:hypothetical protein
MQGNLQILLAKYLVNFVRVVIVLCRAVRPYVMGAPPEDIPLEMANIRACRALRVNSKQMLSHLHVARVHPVNILLRALLVVQTVPKENILPIRGRRFVPNVQQGDFYLQRAVIIILIVYHVPLVNIRKMSGRILLQIVKIVLRVDIHLH